MAEGEDELELEERSIPRREERDEQERRIITSPIYRRHLLLAESLHE